ncbi:MAG: carbamoyltransferase HypF [Megasphaera micronuciformis]|nr:carbamoyltransferase HypF [Megasphaera micronuciformis]
MKALRIRIFGIVQGVGFRPFVSRLAKRCGIVGTVSNRGSYVEVIMAVPAKEEYFFLQALRDEAPPRSQIMGMETDYIDKTESLSGFSIIESTPDKGHIFVSPDIGICDECKRELFDPSDRRYLHPFINCTACGPRLTVMKAMPYDRERTCMNNFPLCSSCEKEYMDPTSRRYDAQPVCCNDCGPQVYIVGTDIKGGEAIAAAREALCEGKIIAVKGIGGFHLCCDATNEAVVDKLRRLKPRPAKPLAVMAKNLETAKRECVVTKAEERLLVGWEKPVVLMKKRCGGKAAPSVAPDNPFLGVMLPYAPLQLLLFSYPDGRLVSDLLVMTSANKSGMPICRSDEDVCRDLLGLCDLVLSHDREILLRVDDSVVTVFNEEPYMIRRSRGYAPLPIHVKGDFHGSVLGAGGELKNTVCLAKDNLFYLSPHIGDVGDIKTFEAQRECAERLLDLLEIKPQLGGADLHPSYEASNLVREVGIVTVPVQHHYAHILSCMAENNCTSPVIGMVLDGTGYGTDGTIWGGELLAASYDGFKRFGSIAPFIHAGGDTAVRDGWRSAISFIYALYGKEAALQKAMELSLCTRKEASAQLFMLSVGINACTSTSAGRLFDGMSALLGLCRTSTFEGEGAMKLQFAAQRYEEDGGERTLPFAVRTYEDGCLILDTLDLVKQVTERFVTGADKDYCAYLFHEGLARLLCSGAEALRQQTGLTDVCLSGGVFQNILLLKLTKRYLEAVGFNVYIHRLVPPNDGGIALGQALAAMIELQKGEKTCV